MKIRDRVNESRRISAADVRSKPSKIVPEIYQIIVDCRDEEEQRIVFEQMTGEGRRCRVLTL